jgi:hypothetical protein
MTELQQLNLQLELQMQALDEKIAQWFVTLDASQIPSSAGVEWKKLAKQHQWGNLLEGSIEGEEPDLTCWLIPLNAEMLSLTLRLAKQHPFSCTWLQSAWSLASISKHWQKISDAQLPNQKRGLLRFYDACVLQTLPILLNKDQWYAIYAPCTAWLHINRIGQLSLLSTPKSFAKPSLSFSLSDKQLAQLQMSNQTDHVIAHLIAEEHLSKNSNPFESYAKVNAAITQLKQHNINDTGLQYAFCMTTLDWTVEDYQSPQLAEQLQLVQQGKLDLYAVKSS